MHFLKTILDEALTGNFSFFILITDIILVVLSIINIHYNKKQIK